MSPNGPDAPTQQYGPDQSQYVPPLESWPPQGHMYDFQAPPPPAQPSVTLPWVFVGLGLFIPLLALIVGVWAFPRTHSDNRYTALAWAGFGVFALGIALNARAMGAL